MNFAWRCSCGQLIWSEMGWNLVHLDFHGQTLDCCPRCGVDLEEEYEAQLEWEASHGG